MKCSTCCCPLPTSGNLCPCGKAAYCTTQCQRQDWKEHKAICPPYKVTKLPGRGRGLLATRKLCVGEVILSELPLMVIDSEDSEVATDVFRGEFNDLDTNTRDVVLGLFDPTTDDPKYELLDNIKEIEATIKKNQEEKPEDTELSSLATRIEKMGSEIVDKTGGELKHHTENEDPAIKAQRIFAANSMQVCEVSALYSPTEGALYHHISFLNHSCNPNSVWSWTKGDFRKKVVRAVKPIMKGEEILVNYVDMEDFNYGSREIRRSVLANKFGFFCKCSECSLEGPEFDLNEQNRAEIVSNLATVKLLMEKFEEKSTVSALQIGSHTVKLVRELGLVYELPRILLNMYQVATAARYQNILGSVNPRLFGEKALSLCTQFGDSFLYFYDFVCKPDKII